MAALIAVSISLGFAGTARASLSWSAPRAVDLQASGVALDRVACPATTQCTAVDGRGQEVTFNPQAPQTQMTVSLGDHTLSGLACPSTTQCTAIDVTGEAFTFNPQSSAGGTPSEVDSSGVPLWLACSSTTQCTAVDASGQEVTFNPQAPGSPTPTVVDANSVLVGVDCAGSTTQCAAVDSSGGAIVFNPQAPAAQSPTSIDGEGPQAMACASSSECIAVDSSGRGASFSIVDGSPEPGSNGPLDGSGSSTVPLTSVACPTSSECVAVDVHGNAVMFDPEVPVGAPHDFDASTGLTSVACPSATQCTAVDDNGEEVTFDPQNNSTPGPAPIDGQTDLSSLSCPSASQCTAVDVGGTEVTFTPGSSAPPTTARVDSGASGTFGVSCPDATQCTAVDNAGEQITFNPRSQGSPAPQTIDSGHALFAVACPSATQCTAVDDGGRELTFNPQASGSPAPQTVDSGHGLPAVACPSTTECIAIDDRGAEVTFTPTRPGTPTPQAMDRVPDSALTCPSTTQCTAVDGSGDEVTFNPLMPSQASAENIDGVSQLSAIACRTITDCVGVDQSGLAVEGDPHGTLPWSTHRVSSNSLVGVDCPSAVECAAIDAPGNAYLGSSGPLPPVPAAVSAPVLKGLPQQAQTLSEGHARWSGAATSYTYQWERCNAAGRRCSSIAGATGSLYTLTHADVGHRIRVEEAAWNITGAGGLRGSRLSPIVGGLVFASRPSISGVSRGAPRLSVALRAAPRTTAMSRITVLLPGGLSGHGGRGIAIASRGKTVVFAVVVRRRTIAIALRRTARLLNLVIESPSLVAGHALIHRAGSRRPKPVQVVVEIVQRDGGITRLTLSLIPR